eukprot:1142940-Pelagomonas_calceolata.AAC.4
MLGNALPGKYSVREKVKAGEQHWMEEYEGKNNLCRCVALQKGTASTVLILLVRLAGTIRTNFPAMQAGSPTIQEGLTSMDSSNANEKRAEQCETIGSRHWQGLWLCPTYPRTARADLLQVRCQCWCAWPDLH